MTFMPVPQCDNSTAEKIREILMMPLDQKKYCEYHKH